MTHPVSDEVLHQVGRISGATKVWLDYYGRAALISAVSRELACDFWQGLQAQGAEQPFAAVYFRRLVHGPGENDRPEHLFGDILPGPFQVAENGLFFTVDFTSGYSTGLFADQQENRLVLRRLRPPTLLNLFSYTCAFSVAAAAAGARTTSVDLAKPCLERGRGNFSLNGLDPGAHRFFQEDVFVFLRRAAKRGERYAMIIVDPPTFSRGAKGKVFRAEKDWPRLLDALWPLLDESGTLFLSTNCRSIGTNDLAALGRAAAQRHGSSPREILPGKVPQQYRGSPVPATIWLHF